MGAEFDAYANADHEIDEGDGVQGDAGQSHSANDVGDDHSDGEGDEEARGYGAEEEGREEEDDSEGGADEGAREADDGGVLVKEDVEFGIREDLDTLAFADSVCDTSG